MSVKEIPESDKPFILAVGSVILFAGEITAGVLALVMAPAAAPAILDFLREPIIATLGFMTTAWAFYLSKS